MLNPITLRHFSHARFNTTPEHQNRHQVAKTVTFACTYYDLYRVLEQKALVISNAVIISKQKATYSLFWPTFDYDETAHIFWLNRRLIQCCPNFLNQPTVWKRKFWQFEKNNFDSLKKKNLTVWKKKFWQFGKGNFDSLEKEILTVWKRKFWQFPRHSLWITVLIQQPRTKPLNKMWFICLDNDANIKIYENLY